MTVLSETDDVDDPIVEVMKSLLDGHIVLSRSIAEQGQFPAVDVIRSVSRGLQKRTSTSHRSAITEAVRLLSAWNEARVMIETGAYRAGASALVDRAITQRDALREFLTQGQEDRSPFGDAVTGLKSAVGEVRHGA